MFKPTEEFWRVFKATPGALSCTEALGIMYVCQQVPEDGLKIELGTHKGKSAIAALQTMKGEMFVLVDPIFSDQQIVDDLGKTLASACHDYTVAYVADFSTNVIPMHEQYSYVFVDSGSHGDGLPMQEVKMLEDRIRPEGIIAFHDYLNQFVEVQKAYEYLLSTGKYEPINIPWNEIIPYVKENNLEVGNESWHIYHDNPYPNFVGAVKRKI